MSKCDLIMPVWNELKLTRDCLESLKKNTDFPYRLIVIDNGSDEETAGYLRDLNYRFPEYTLIRFEENLGFVKAINAGLKIVNAKYICLVNNDTIFTKGWLSEMVNIIESNKEIGVLNPSSNSWGEWPPDSNLEEYANKISTRRGQWQESSYCIGFCMMFKKEVLEKVGYLDEIYGLGYLEETDFCRRVQKLGYLCGIAKGAYVYHIGGQTFRRFSNHRLQYENNLKLFNKRWGRILRIAFVIGNNKIEKDKVHHFILSALRDYHMVRIYYHLSYKDKIWLPDHAGLRLCEIKGAFFRLKVFFRILSRQLKQRKNKNFDMIIVKYLPFPSMFNLLFFFHKPTIMFNPEPKEAQSVWQRLSKEKI